LEYHLTLARDIQAISLSDATSLLDQTIEVIKMLRGLIKSVSKTDNPDPANQLSRRRTATS
ncbi:MAG: hypothetical protein ACJ770_09075, partial [Gemmatimonadaceae bacterium]